MRGAGCARAAWVCGARAGGVRGAAASGPQVPAREEPGRLGTAGERAASALAPEGGIGVLGGQGGRSGGARSQGSD